MPHPSPRPVLWSAALACLLASAGPAGAFPGTLEAWQDRYGAVSPSGDNAGCQLCHVEANGGSPWNAYGWDLRDALIDAACDLNADGSISNDEAFYCVELLDSDGDSLGTDNVTEIQLGTQPGWTLGANNTWYSRSGELPNQLPPEGIGQLDPDGSEPPPPPPPPPPADEVQLPPGQMKRKTIVVRPGQSIQAAIDQAAPYTTIYVLGGTYKETADPTNGLTISKSGIRLIGQSNPAKRVVLANAGNQRNGIVVVPPANTDCMGCHTTMAPPFSIKEGVEPGLMGEPELYDIEIRGITIQGFVNNGLFTERVDGYKIIDVESIDNKNYGIFPTLSRNGVVTHSKATGSDDSGIWIETSDNVQVTYNLVEENVNGFELSNSDDVLFAHNVARMNTVGFAVLLLPDIFDDRPGSKRITIRDNHIYDNNKENTAREGSILSLVPSGTGILHTGPDDSVYRNNRIENHDFFGLAMADYCLVVLGTPYGCEVDPGPPGYIIDQASRNNTVVGNVFVDNGNRAPAGHDFEFAAGDISVVTLGPGGNCFEDNVFTKFFSLFGFLPACP